MNVDPADMTEDQRSAWLASLTTDELAVLHVPCGSKLTLLFIAYIKYILTTQTMTTGHRLRFLEWINNAVDVYITPEILAAIEPMSETEVKMLLEVRSLDREDDKIGLASFKVLPSWMVFNHFLSLNPSLLGAIKMRRSACENDTNPIRYSPAASAPALGGYGVELGG
ncbi:MAG: hypothetical protein ABSE22_14695 [Xanthobacteraceae bacterium]